MLGGTAESGLCSTLYVLPAQEQLPLLVSMHRQNASTAPINHSAKEQLATMPQVCTVGLKSLRFYRSSSLQCNSLPPEIGRRTKRTLDSINIATKYCSSQTGITFCLRCIELDLARRISLLQTQDEKHATTTTTHH